MPTPSGSRIAGPAVFLKPETAQIIALVLHELATNAVKYGALSDPAGKVRLSWQCEQNKLGLQWVETGGPSVTPPTTKGYGTKVITASIQQQLSGAATFDWRPAGLAFDMAISIGDTPHRKRRRESRGRPRPVSTARSCPPRAGACFWSRTKRWSA